LQAEEKLMQVTEIEAHASRTFNHPYESYSNFRLGVTIRATIGPGEDVDLALMELRRRADQQAEDAKQGKLAFLAREHEERRRGLFAAQEDLDGPDPAEPVDDDRDEDETLDEEGEAEVDVIPPATLKEEG
jgi:hypothetical protein